MKNNASVVYSLFLVIGDFIALACAFAAAYFLRFRLLDGVPTAGISGQTFFYAILTTLPLWIVIHALMGLYSQSVYERRFSELGRLLVASVTGMLTVIGYDFFAEGTLFPGRLVPLYGLGLGLSFLVLFRTLARVMRRWLFRYGIGVSDVLIVGDTDAAAQLIHDFRATNKTGIRVLGVVGRHGHSVRKFPNFAAALKQLSNSPIHGIIQTELYADQQRNDEILAYARDNHISYRFVPGNADLFVGNISVDLFGNVPMIAVHQTALIGWGRVAKRLFDVLIASLVLAVLSPLMLLVALLIKLSDPREPVFFRQIRLTRHNREFRVFKFRSIKHGYNCSPEEGFARMGRPDLLKQYRENGDYLPNDPRFTRIGRFIRATSIDELPQLFNVLFGDLSLVGPRTLVPQELNSYERKHSILSVKAGITGLAQVSGRKDISFEERRTLDIYYVQNWSFWLDISILIRTLRVVFTGSGDK
jgi:exopolysaccharide biosynthesis polyprenyl glycosylphosphotransferase